MKKDYLGTLFLVVGNSGSGKDSIITGVVNKFPQTLKQIHIPKRYITRESSEFEKNIFISPDRFKEMEKNSRFALKWHIYELDYGVPIEIDEWLKKGHPVIINVSRTIIENARQIYSNIKVIFIEVPFEITKKRIEDRARESGKRLEERIERARTHQKLPEADFVVDNSDTLENAIEQFFNYLLKNIESDEK
ncbi:MAG: phosphonate metabolism protein/1,5-bisphosphokinase (PRPP-forming) PhnN [Candidatus Hermodarchaeota archaeon]